MKMKMFLMLLFLGLGGLAQEMTIEIADFDAVEIDSGLRVNFIQSDDNRAVVSGSKREEVRIYNENQKLIISSRLRKIVEEKSAIVNIYYRDLKSVDAKENSDIELCGTIEQPEIAFIAREGAGIVAELNVNNLKATVITGGVLTLSGEAEIQNIEVRSEGFFRGEYVVGENVNVTIKGGGTANVNSILSVDAEVEAGGEVYIYGDPEKIVQNPGIAGTIQKIN